MNYFFCKSVVTFFSPTLFCEFDKDLLTLFYSINTPLTALESFGGQRLLQVADINTGAAVHTMFRIKVPQEEFYNKQQDQRQVLFMRKFHSEKFWEDKSGTRTVFNGARYNPR